MTDEEFMNLRHTAVLAVATAISVVILLDKLKRDKDMHDLLEEALARKEAWMLIERVSAKEPT